ncbi:ribonuclease H-like domain-containing protein [Tanacetum coccineum]
MRTKPGVDSLSFDDLYNNLRVFESDVKGSTRASSSAQNDAFVSSESTSSTNDVSTTYGVSTSSGYNSQMENSSSYTDELMYYFFANQSSGPQLDHEDLEQLDERLQFDAKEPVGFDKTKVECFNCHKTRHFPRECRSKGNQESRRRDAGNTGYKAKDNERRPRKQEEPKALVTLDGEGVDWTGHAEDEQENFALMAYSNSGSDTEREQLGDANIEIQAFTQALEKVEAQLVAHQKNQLWYEEKIRFMKIDLDDKTDVLTYHKKLLAEAVKEKEELKTKLENFQSSSKGLSKLLNSQMSTRDKSGLGYGNQIHEGVLSYEKEVLESVFDSRSSDVEDSPVYDRFAKVEGMHAVPPPMTGNYMPPKSDFGIDESNFTYGPKQSKTSESDAKTSDFDSCETNSSVETLESVPEPVVVEPKVVSQPKVWSDDPIIEEYEETVKEQNTYSPSPKADKRDWNGLMSKRLGLGYGFTKKACFVCGSFSHLIRDCDFHEKRMAKQVELNKQKAVLTRTGRIPVNTARHNFNSQAVSTSAARKVSTARPIVQLILLSTCGLELSLDANLRKGNYWKHGCSLSVGFYHHTTNGHQFTMSNRHQELTSLEQTASALAIPGQTETGKESSNPLMADSLPKTIQSNDPPLSRGYTLRSEEESLKLMELMAYYTNLCEFAIFATIDRKVKVLASEASIRRHLKLEDSEGLSSLPNVENFEQLVNMGYVTDSDSLTFQKGHFPPQWKFFIHTILHCLSPKKTAWDQFSSNLATAVICLAAKRIFNFSKFLFEAMV